MTPNMMPQLQIIMKNAFKNILLIHVHIDLNLFKFCN